MRQWLINFSIILLPLFSGPVLAQVDTEELTHAVSGAHSYLPSLAFDKKQSGPFHLSIEQRSYSDGSLALRNQRNYMQQEQLRLSQGQGLWSPPVAPMLGSVDDDDNDSLYEQTLFQLMYRFSFD